MVGTDGRAEVDLRKDSRYIDKSWYLTLNDTNLMLSIHPSHRQGSQCQGGDYHPKLRRAAT